jgi:hypothetical protein
LTDEIGEKISSSLNYISKSSYFKTSLNGKYKVEQKKTKKWKKEKKMKK